MGVMKATVAALALMNTRVRGLKLIYFQPYFWMVFNLSLDAERS